MPRGPNLSRAERAIHFACTLAGMPLDEINEILAEKNMRPLLNYDELKPGSLYYRYFVQDLSRIGEAIRHPPTRAEAKSAIDAFNDTNT